MQNPVLHIAIDGPVASGKGEIAARLSHRLGILYVYTGGMYRALGLACIQRGISCKDSAGVRSLLNNVSIDIIPPDHQSAKQPKIVLNGNDVTQRIVEQDTAHAASDVATIPEVRAWMVAKQQELARGRSVVMEGRDICTRVLPGAQLKIFLTASVEERARRRWRQYQANAIQKTYEETLEDIQSRDLQDITRSVDPLVACPDAWILDTTGMKPEQAVDAIVRELTKRRLL